MAQAARPVPLRTGLPVVEIDGKLYALRSDGSFQRLRLAQATDEIKAILSALATAIPDPAWITQDLEGDGATTVFALTGFDDVITDDLSVIIAAAFQHDGYTLAAGTLTFDVAPPKYAPIHVRASTARLQLTALLQALRDLA